MSAQPGTRNAKVTPIRKAPSRPKLADISLDRDLYLELCEELGFAPLPVVAS